eukprot:GFKZ01000493.1.p1 GENE.GFKZ01000493.1~~GFKZ01000493.1.p1  ORF type:complete len:1429 (+),score=134.87 GFKZ01000493.1:200-4288(+)
MVLPDPAVHIVLGSSPKPSAPQLRPPFDPQCLPSTGPIIVWFRGHDLRIHDHIALDSAVSTGRQIVALYILERGAETDGISAVYCRNNNSPQPWGPLSPNGGFALGRVQRWYLHHSLRVLDSQLTSLGITLVLRRVDCSEATAAVVADVARSVRASAVFWNKRYKPRAYPVDSDVRQRLNSFNVVAEGFCSETLMEPRLTNCGRYDDFQTYTTFWIDAMRTSPPPRPNPPLEVDSVSAMSRNVVEYLLSAETGGTSDVEVGTQASRGRGVAALPEVEDLELLDGLNVEGEDMPGDVSTIGCAAAKLTLANFLTGDRFQRFSSGSARRDGMVTGKNLATSRLSPHVRFGEISPRVLFYEIVDAGAVAKLSGDQAGLQSARTFLKNMSLREFGYYMLLRYPAAACKPIMPEFEVFPWVKDNDGVLTEAWETGTTGFPIVDAAMRQLLREGWIHNRMRFLVASFFCKYLLLPWPVGAAHMVRTLVDGDEACNSLGWQWTAGCNSDSFPFSTLVNPLSLHLHTQSTRVAANYVRKYVPELATLPDSLVFTPWKATDEERRALNICILEQKDYRQIRGHQDPIVLRKRADFGLYPSRIVNGPDARTRARHAMEVMRRIFSAQRQCRTYVVDQSPGPDGTSWTKVRERFLYPEAKSITDEDGSEMECVDISTSAVTESDVTLDGEYLKNGLKRVAEEAVRTSEDIPAKKRRVHRPSKVVATKNRVESSSEISDVMSVSMITGAPTGITPSEVDLLLSSSQCSTGGSGSKELPKKSRGIKDGEAVTGVGLCTRGMDLVANDAGSAAKRPRGSGTRAATNNFSGSSSEGHGKLSVQALLTSGQAGERAELMAEDASVDRRSMPRPIDLPVRTVVQPPPQAAGPSSLSRPPAPVVHPPPQAPAPSSLRPPAPTPVPARTQTLPVGRAVEPQSPSFATHLGGTGGGGIGVGTTGLSFPNSPMFSSPAFASSPDPHRQHPLMQHYNTRGTNQHPVTLSPLVGGSVPSGFPQSGSPTATFRHSGIGGAGKTQTEANSLRRGSGRSRTVHGMTMNTNIARHGGHVIGQHGQGSSFVGGQNAGQGMMFQGVGQVPVIPTHFAAQPAQAQHQQNPQVMVPFRGAGPMEMGQMGHTGVGGMHGESGQSNLFGVPPGMAAGHNHHHQGAGPMFVYPTMSPYVDMRISGLPGAVQPMLHPVLQQQAAAAAAAGGVPVGFSRSGGLGMRAMGNGFGAGGGPVAIGRSAGRQELDVVGQGGPRNAMEREAIARKMAAMNYYDEAYGGKHWEQWQAIALHLLDQYEFSEDTDRETSKAYVRLCVLKDELRDANPDGPRVTVNHCKEVFNILRLPVTGEWDRRGHGGVRGPYCYGCVKRGTIKK